MQKGCHDLRWNHGTLFAIIYVQIATCQLPWQVAAISFCTTQKSVRFIAAV
jgi:hypothetical protein